MHSRIDRASVLAVLTRPEITLQGLSAAVQALELAYREIDRVLLQKADCCPSGVPGYSPRLPSIHRDLTALQVPRDAWEEAEPGSCLKVPDTEAGYLGMRYVVEGAQLGSQVIYRHLHAAFGSELHRFGSFWMPGSIIEGSWPSVLKSLTQVVQSRESLATATRAARMTFRHMELYLTRNRPEAS
jgi:heme oxygenase